MHVFRCYSVIWAFGRIWRGEGSQSIHPSIHPSNHPSIHPSNYPSIHPSNYPSIHSCRISRVSWQQTKEGISLLRAVNSSHPFPLEDTEALRGPGVFCQSDWFAKPPMEVKHSGSILIRCLSELTGSFQRERAVAALRAPSRYQLTPNTKGPIHLLAENHDLDWRLLTLNTATLSCTVALHNEEVTLSLMPQV